MKPRFLICIPIYNNESTAGQVIAKCLALSSHSLLVVDDGSTLEVEMLVKSENIPTDRITFLRHEQNEGKGKALRTGFHYALKHNYTHVVTIDADGQHDPSEIVKLTQAAEHDPFSLVIGDREMKTANVPSSSTFGKAFSNFWVKYETDAKVADSQSGFRCYPLFFMQNMNFFCTKYDFEIEVLIRLIWAGVRIQNVKISVVYFPPEKRISHFHKIKDNFRLTTLNICLILVSLITEQTSPFKSAFAVAIGVFVGVLPVFGLHTIIVAGISFLFRLNFIYLWMGTHVSTPPLIPFVVMGSNAIGKLFFQHFYQHPAGFTKSVAVGSVFLGLILGLITFVVVYQLKKKLNKTDKAWTGQDRNKTGVAIMHYLMQKIGIQFAYFIINFVAFYYYVILFRARKSIVQYWKIISPEIGYFARQKKVYQQFLVFSKTLIDRAYQREMMTEKFEYELDASALDFAKSFEGKSKGAVIIASHIGGWELAMSFFASRKNLKKMVFVMHGLEQQSQHHSIQTNDSRAQIVYYNTQQHTVMKLKQQLAEGQFVGLMGDRPVTKNFEQKLFFGKLAQFDTAGLRIALACEAEVRFIFSFKTGLFKYKIFAIKGLVNPSLSQQEKIDSLLAQYIQSLEQLLRLHPNQWFNFFPFWSTPPVNS